MQALTPLPPWALASARQMLKQRSGYFDERVHDFLLTDIARLLADEREACANVARDKYKSLPGMRYGCNIATAIMNRK